MFLQFFRASILRFQERDKELRSTTSIFPVIFIISGPILLIPNLEVNINNISRDFQFNFPTNRVNSLSTTYQSSFSGIFKNTIINQN